MKKFLALLLAMAMTIALVACGGDSGSQDDSAGDKTPAATDEKTPADTGTDTTPPADTADDVASEITAWIYPVGGWGDEAKVKPLVDAFTAETGIKVNLEWLAYADGDDKVNTAIAAEKAPDLVMEGPERLVANWGASGYMVDLNDMLDDEDRSEINSFMLDASTSADGSVYLYPMFITAHCMAVNLDAFKEAGADQYLDLDTHTWTVEQFDAAIAALYDHFGGTIGAVYCAGQGGDQGTRELINNRYATRLTDAEHTKYTWDDPKTIQAIQDLYDMPGIDFDASIAGGDEIALFYQEILKVAFCWNAAQQMNPNSADTGAGKTINGQEIVYMGFPSPTGTPILGDGIWGLGIFDSGDQARINASKKFIKFMCDSEHAGEASDIAGFLPARSSAEGHEIKANDPLLVDYCDHMLPYLGDYYQVTTGWAEARTAWWNMLQKIGEGNDVAATVAEYVAQANAVTG